MTMLDGRLGVRGTLRIGLESGGAPAGGHAGENIDEVQRLVEAHATL